MTIAAVLLAAVAAPAVAAAPSTASSGAKARAVVLAAKLSGPSTATAGHTVSFSTAKSAVPRGDKIARYSISFGDGTKKVTRTVKEPRTLTHTFTKPGRYTTTLILTDVHRKTSRASVKVHVISPGPQGVLSFVAGNGTDNAPTPGPATATSVEPVAVAVDSSGNIYAGDEINNVVDKITPAGTLSVIAGTGPRRSGVSGYATPGPATSSPLGEISYDGVAVDRAGDVYITDRYSDVITKVDPSGTLSIVAETGQDGPVIPGPATSSNLADPQGIAMDGSGNLYIDDYSHNLIEKVDPAGTLSIVAGNGNMTAPTPGPATSSGLVPGDGIAVDPAGNIYFDDAYGRPDPTHFEVVRVTPTGTLSIVAGTNDKGPVVPGPATRSNLIDPLGLATDSSGNLYICDTGHPVGNAERHRR